MFDACLTKENRREIVVPASRSACAVPLVIEGGYFAGSVLADGA